MRPPLRPSTPGTRRETPESRENNAVQYKPTGQSTDEAFKAFVDELAAGATDLLARMKLGHEPDEHGWCRHTTHEHHWESHPCSMLRLALLAETDTASPAR
jgi:hypothetical protein